MSKKNEELAEDKSLRLEAYQKMLDRHTPREFETLTGQVKQARQHGKKNG